MANMVGTVTPFDSQSQSWEEYCEILQHFFVANEITEAVKQRAILLSTVGGQTYSLLRNLLSPVKPGEEGETVLEYVAVLRKLAHDCNYGEKLTEMLRDRLVCGINDDRIQRRLLAEADLTFEKALKVAQATEMANKDVRDLQAKHSETSVSMRVHKMAVKQEESQSRACYRCGSLQHLANECRFVSEKCHKCGKQGHIMKVCKSKSSTRDTNLQGGERRKRVVTREQRSYYVGREEKSASDEEGIFTVHSLKETEIPKVAPLTITLAVNEIIIPFEVDTGCGVTVMNG
ncbi:hypothetical protein PO909_030083 [Leuciscus waleckii]